jgi:hypothetical protein
MYGKERELASPSKHLATINPGGGVSLSNRAGGASGRPTCPVRGRGP